jgi:hypothetical protein
MKRFVMISATLAALTLSSVAQAQAASAPPPAAAMETVTPEKLALARQVFQIMNLKQMMDGMNTMTATMTRTMVSKLPDAQQKRMAGFQTAMNEEMRGSFVPKLIDQMSDAYARTFTADELRGILAFYKSPTGEALVQKTPTLMQNLMPAVMQDMPDLLRGAINRYCTENTCTAQERAAFDKTVAGMPGAHS